MIAGILLSLCFYNIEIWNECPLNDRKKFLNFLLNSILCFESSLMYICGICTNNIMLGIVLVILFSLTVIQRHKMYDYLFKDMEIVEVTKEVTPKKRKTRGRKKMTDKDCPYCGTMNIDYDPKTEMYTCPDCGAEIDADEIDNINGQRLSVYDAADIWMSSGFDEDQMFGYTEEELKKALK